MRPSVLLPLVALVVLWACALWFWPTLPAHIPAHFDGAGRPDRFVERSASAWFLLPGIGTALVLAFAFVLPVWIEGLAASNSPYLNVPRKQDFARLDPEARRRAIAPTLVLLHAIGAEVALLFALILLGSARVASGAWAGLPPALVWLPVGVLIVTALASVPFAHRAVARELARAAGGHSRR